MDYNITAKENPQMFRDVQFEGGADTYTLNAAGWTEDRNPITSVIWEVVHGQAVVSGQTLADDVASALVSFPQCGRTLLKVILETGVEKYVAFIDVIAKDPFTLNHSFNFGRDYWH